MRDRRFKSCPCNQVFLSVRYSVYILRNLQGQHYVGLSEDVQHRLIQHNNGVSTWTRYRGPWELIWQREFADLSTAKRFESLLKKQKGGSGFYELTGLRRLGS
jgi:putative endonuclease